MYSINFTITKKKFCLSLHYNGANSYLFVNSTEIYKFKAKDSEVLVGPICLGNISKDCSVDNMKKTGFNGYVHDFSVDYEYIAVDDIGYITIKKIGDCKNIYSVNPLYLRIAHANGYIEEINESKCIIFDSANENKELLKKCNDVFNGIRDKIKEICNDECDYEKDYMKIKFNSDDNFPLNKPLKFHLMIITIRSVFEEEGKLYLQVFLDDTLYELNL